MRLRLPSKRAMYWVCQLAGWGLFLTVNLASTWVLGVDDPDGKRFLITGTILQEALGFLLSMVLRRWYQRRAPAGVPLTRAVVELIFASTVLGAVWSALSLLANRALIHFGICRINGELVQLHLKLWKEHPLFAASVVWLVCTATFVGWSFIYLGYHSLSFARAQRERAREAQTLATRAQLDLLRYQLNPHFLFNTLNSLRGLISEQPARAEQLVTELAEFLRSTLLPTGSEAVPLAREVEIARTYLSIEQARFEEGLEVRFDIAPELEKVPVPPLLLNPLVENAIKYGMQTSPHPLRIHVVAQRAASGLRLQVSNTGRLLQAGDTGHGGGLGLRNVRERLALTRPGQHAFALKEEAGWVHAVVELAAELPPAEPWSEAQQESA